MRRRQSVVGHTYGKSGRASFWKIACREKWRILVGGIGETRGEQEHRGEFVAGGGLAPSGSLLSVPPREGERDLKSFLPFESWQDQKSRPQLPRVKQLLGVSAPFSFPFFSRCFFFWQGRSSSARSRHPRTPREGLEFLCFALSYSFPYSLLTLHICIRGKLQLRFLRETESMREV